MQSRHLLQISSEQYGERFLVHIEISHLIHI
jgi:hypothetical protein